MNLLDPGKALFESSPKKKKKYILFLFSHGHSDENQISTIEKAMHTAIPEYIILRLEDPNEGMKALLVKNIEMVFIDSSYFDDDKTSIDYALECKKRKKCPIFFTAKNETLLIKEYKKTLFAYEEFDDYFKHPIDFIEVSKKLKRASLTIGRKAKRFSLNVPVKLFRLNFNKNFEVLLTDISLIGFGIFTEEDEDTYTHNEQVKINIPLHEFNFFHPIYGDFLPLAGKVRQISINGQRIGFSIEHASPIQIETLMVVLERITKKLAMAKVLPNPPKITPPTNLF